jgi:DNA-directed RNA polymerase subunit omega
MEPSKIIEFEPPHQVASASPGSSATMKSELVEKASEVIPNKQVLINMVSRRVRQLNQGRPPLIRLEGRMGEADIALTEIIEGKIILSPQAENTD